MYKTSEEQVQVHSLTAKLLKQFCVCVCVVCVFFPISKFHWIFFYEVIFKAFGQHFDSMFGRRRMSGLTVTSKQKQLRSCTSKAYLMGRDGKDCALKQLRQRLGRCLFEPDVDKLWPSGAATARLRTGGSEHFADERECFSAQRADGQRSCESGAKSSNLAPV